MLLRRPALAFAALAALAPGCNERSDACIALSEDDVVMTAYILDNGARARAEVEFRRAGEEDGVPLRLCDKSSLHVDGASTTRVRRPSGASVYRAEVPRIAAEATTHSFSLRDGEDAYEYTATIDAPAFLIVAPKPGARLSRVAMWDLAWSPPRPGATIVARVDDTIDGETCLGAPVVLELPDAGSAKIGSGQLEVAEQGIAAVDQCDAYIQLSRTAVAALEPTGGATSRLHPDSRVEAATSRELAFVSVP